MLTHQPTSTTIPILQEEMEAAVKSLKKGKSAGVDNNPAELVQAGGEAMINAHTVICNKIWQTREWHTLWTQSLVMTLPKKGNPQQCKNKKAHQTMGEAVRNVTSLIPQRLRL